MAILANASSSPPTAKPTLNRNSTALNSASSVARGDSTDAAVQVQTLKHFGISAQFKTNGSLGSLDALLAQGIPVPIGILHHGPASAPSGGGHWLLVIGKDGDNYIVNDPWGEIDNATGTYPNSDGNHKKYSKDLISKRWTVEGPGSGWFVQASK